jgi:restriction endonuclease Mrr
MVQLPNSKALNDAILAVLARYPKGLKTNEIDSAVADLLGLTEEQRSQIRQGNRSELSYRLAWERTHAKRAGTIVRVGTRTWMLAENPKSNNG